MPRTLRQRLTAALGQLFDATNPREIYARPFEPPVVRPITEEVSPHDRERLMSDSRKLYANLGPCKGGIDDKAMYAVGRAWLPRFEGEDREWGARAREWLLNEWYPLAEISGQDFQTALYLLSVSIDRDGDAGGLLTEYQTGFPAIQLIGAESVGTRDWKAEGKPIKAGPYRGLVLRDGVVLNEQGRAVAYRLKAVEDDSDPAAWISARDLAWLFEPNWIGAQRGVPGFASSILDLRDLRTTQGYEKMASALASSIGLLEYNETGLADPNDPANLGSLPVVQGMSVQEILGGLVKHYKAGTGQKLEAFKNDRPGDAWQRFMDRLLRNAFAGIGWPYELAWDISALGGANTRFIIAKAMRAVEDRQDLLRPFAKRAVGYACAKAIKQGILDPSPDWWKWNFTMPARLTSDYGRDAAAQREDYLNGIINLSDICEERGKDFDQHVATRAEENAKLRAAGLPVPGAAFEVLAEPVANARE